jgi:phosphoserine aminotransferase
MNVTFNFQNQDLLAPFIEQAESLGLYALKGHRDVGGARASIYNAMPVKGCEALAQFMLDFEKKNS